MPWSDPVTLEGRHVRLEPLTLAHVDALSAAGLDESIWRWMPVHVTSPAGMEAFVHEALAGHGTSLAFVTMVRATGEVVGSTRYLNMVPAHRRLEIGGTWITPRWQRSAVNTEAKYLMLRHAFDAWGCQRVEFKTHARNERSRAALLRLGAVEEGVFRKHMVQDDGSTRDSAWYSIVDDEWPAVRSRLEGAIHSEGRGIPRERGGPVSLRGS